MPAPQLTVHNAEIKTATVEIKTLTVSGKQVTLAVFRQLREVPLISDDGTLNGVPWGIVNYHPDKCADGADHWHIVWQRGTELLRSKVIVKPTFALFTTDTGDHFMRSHVRDVARGGSRFLGGKMPRAPRGPSGSWKPKFHVLDEAPIRAGFNLDENNPYGIDLWKLIDTYESLSQLERQIGSDGPGHYMWRELESRRGKLDQMLNAIDVTVGPSGPNGSGTERLFRKFVAEVDAEAERQERHRKVRQSLRDLPQLFIAV